VADIAKLSIGREEYYTRELATDHEQYLSGHGESRGRWYGAAADSLRLEGEASPAGFQAMFEGRDPTTGELLGCPHSRNAVPAFDVVLRPTKSVSIPVRPGRPGHRTGGPGRPPRRTGRGGGLLDQHLGAAVGMAVSSTCPDRGAGGRLRPPDLPGGRSAAAHPSGGRQPGPGAGRPLDGLGWPGPVSASAGRGRHLPGQLPAGALPDAWGGVDAGGHLWQPRAGRHARGAGAQLLQAHRPDRHRTGPAGRRRSGADTAAGQVDGPGHPQAQAARGPGKPV
jgi:TrwC relaxase